MSMRIVQIGAYPLAADHIDGGIEASVYGLSQTQSRDCEVHVFDCPRKNAVQRVENDNGVVVHRFVNQGRRQVSSAREAKRMAEEIVAINPDVCHIHGTNLFSWMMYRALRKREMPVVVTIHGLAWVEKKNALQRKFSFKKLFQFLYQGWVEKRFLSQLPMAIVDTEYVKDRVLHYPIRKKPKMHVIPQGIDESFFMLRCSEGSRLVVSIGAIGPRKGHLLTLKAFEMMRQKVDDARLVIAGTIADYSYLEQLREYAEQSEFDCDISICTDLPNEDIRQLYEEAHLFALHSEEESQGIVLVEAMASGLPIVATCVGGVPFVVAHEKNGLLLEYGDVKAFADAMGCLMTDEKKWVTLSDASRKKAQDYHWSDIGNSVLSIYQSIVENNKSV